MSTLNLKPEHDFVFVEEAPKVSQTKSAFGIIIAEVQKYADGLKGKIVAVSETSEYPLTVEVGDTVYYNEVSVKSRTVLDGKTYAIVREVDLFAYERN
jgi:co-chaperonin GroES (HSP10)